jgi:hypothetical protein
LNSCFGIHLKILSGRSFARIINLAGAKGLYP